MQYLSCYISPDALSIFVLISVSSLSITMESSLEIFEIKYIIITYFIINTLLVIAVI